MFVHTVFLFFIPLMAIAAYLLAGRRRESCGDREPRLADPFLVFYTAYEVTVGVGAGILVDYANGLPAREQAAVADAIQEYTGSPILGDPMSVSLALALLGWVVAMVAAAVALYRAGAGWPVTLLVGFGAVFAIHPPPVGPVGLVCFAAAAVLIERARAREAKAVVRDRLPPDLARRLMSVTARRVLLLGPPLAFAAFEGFHPRREVNAQAVMESRDVVRGIPRHSTRPDRPGRRFRGDSRGRARRRPRLVDAARDRRVPDLLQRLRRHRRNRHRPRDANGA